MNVVDQLGMAPVALAQVPDCTVADTLRREGLVLDVGLARVRVRSTCPSFAPHLRSVYRHHRFEPAPAWADLHVQMRPGRGWRRWIAPQARLLADGGSPFQPFPADTALPLFEWGCNWLIGQRMNHRLLLHAGVVERDGRALVMPAMPGSGKSTLTAALSLSGWRLLSDEFGALDPASGLMQAVLKPVALKNGSIDVIERLRPGAALGPRFEKTRKGTVAHLAASPDAVQRMHERVPPGAVVLPRWKAGSPTRLEPVSVEAAFSALAFNAFNYATMGEAGFAAVLRVVRQCPAWQLVYSDLDDALARLDALWSQGPEGPAAGGVTGALQSGGARAAQPAGEAVAEAA